MLIINTLTNLIQINNFNHISLVWRLSGGKSVNVNAVENGPQSFKEVKDIR